MGYLYSRDFHNAIQDNQLLQVTRNDASVLVKAELTSLAEARSYLVQKYDTTQEFAFMAPWDNTVVYNAKTRVYIDYTAYVQQMYAIGAKVTNGGIGYICIATISAPEVFTPAHWTAIGAQYTIYYASLPYPQFDLNGVYILGAIVWWGNKTYVCNQATVVQQPPSIQYGTYENVPPQNCFPDAVGQTQWITPTVYNVPAGTLPTNTTYWTAGDNRDQQMVTYLVCLVLYYIHMAIAPRNIPDIRVKAYDDACKWFKAAAKGDVTAALPVIQPKQGRRVRWGGQIKINNTY